MFVNVTTSKLNEWIRKRTVSMTVMYVTAIHYYSLPAKRTSQPAKWRPYQMKWCWLEKRGTLAHATPTTSVLPAPNRELQLTPTFPKCGASLSIHTPPSFAKSVFPADLVLFSPRPENYRRLEMFRVFKIQFNRDNYNVLPH